MPLGVGLVLLPFALLPACRYPPSIMAKPLDRNDLIPRKNKTFLRGAYKVRI